MLDQNGSLTSPPFNLVFGNLPALVDLYKGVPADAHPHSPITLLHRKLHLSGVYYLDTWPASPERQMIIADPVSEYSVWFLRNAVQFMPVIRYAGSL